MVGFACHELPVRQRSPIQPRFSDEQKACCELVRMIAASGINVRDYLGQEHTITTATDNRDLVGQLQQFVGADGRLTPIVKSTELKLNVEGLKAIEVVDTPGMNDPIISRGRRTQEFIGQVENDDIARLRQVQGRIVGVLVNEMAAEVDASVTEILGRLSAEKDQFIPELTQDLNAQVEQLSQDLQNSEQKMGEYNQVLELVSEDLEKLAV
ncbi:hypothetical protein [Endozoicomonas sp. 8E]|uniref:hypothetical protein n=1 Tax=Endozoicomonas sp. 8E TaxID=3035692 RepID=UPI002938D5B1|nr:hypothetical protein [Endozoicomonas sp. 8E]WOG30236.1 hypothetical protein P6910_11520 [Endozoicomonas sp. 8E]